MRTKYKSGIPFDKTLASNILLLKERIEENKASCMIVDGFVGSGKTTLAVHIADYYQGSPIDLKKQLAMGGVEFQEKLALCRKEGLSVLIYDEAGDYDKTNWGNQLNKALNRVFDTFRAFRIFIILVLPNMKRLPDQLFDKGVVQMLVHVNERTNYGNYMVYSLYRITYLRKNMDKLVSPLVAYKITHPNFRGHFLDLDENRSEKLKEISLAGKDDLNAMMLIQSKGLKKMDEIAKIVGKSKSWVKGKVLELEIQPAHQHKNTHYFDHDQFIMLKEEAE